ncbi:hypothetical protein YA52_02485 [Enterobacter roggenkampii]|nr:hypothetical protein YA52_02485 [Enterobacter roggenkampii]
MILAWSWAVALILKMDITIIAMLPILQAAMAWVKRVQVRISAPTQLQQIPLIQQQMVLPLISLSQH